MKKSEKEKHYDTIQTIRESAGGCFGIVDAKFAMHSSDEDNAKALKKLAKANNVNLEEIREIFLLFLFNKTKSIEHIETEMKKITKFFK